MLDVLNRNSDINTASSCTTFQPNAKRQSFSLALFRLIVYSSISFFYLNPSKSFSMSVRTAFRESELFPS